MRKGTHSLSAKTKRSHSQLKRGLETQHRLATLFIYVFSDSEERDVCVQVLVRVPPNNEHWNADTNAPNSQRVVVTRATATATLLTLHCNTATDWMGLGMNAASGYKLFQTILITHAYNKPTTNDGIISFLKRGCRCDSAPIVRPPFSHFIIGITLHDISNFLYYSSWRRRRECNRCAVFPQGITADFLQFFGSVQLKG